MIDAEVNKALKDNERKVTLKFNTCLVLMKDIEYVVNNATNIWRNVFHFQKLGEYPIEIKVDDDDSDKYEDNDEDTTQFVTIDTIDYLKLMKDDEEEKEEEATKEDKQEEEIDPVKIAMAIISSLPHSPVKLATSSSSEIASVDFIVTTIDTSNV